MDHFRMGRERFAGVIPELSSVEWAVVVRSKEGVERAGAGRVAVALADDKDVAAVVPVEIGAIKGRVATGLPSDLLLLRVVELPDVPGDELRSMARLQVDKFSPFPSDSMVIAHEVLGRRDTKCLVLIAAARDEVIRDAGKRLGTMGLIAGRMDARIMGRWHGVRNSGLLSGRGREVLLFKDGPVPELIVTEHGIPVLFRLLGEVEGLEGEECEAEMARAISYTLVSVEMEHGESPHSICLWHGEGEGESLRARLAQDCGCEVKLHALADLPTAAEGVAARWLELGSEGINLIPDDWKQAGVSAVFRQRMLAAVGGAVGLWILLAVMIFGGLFYNQARLERLQGEQESWQQKGREVRDMRRRVFVITRYMDTSHSALECLREVSTTIPDGVDLTSFSYRKGEEVKISGESMAVTEIYSFKNRLDQSKLFSGAVLNGPRRDPRRSKELFDVDIKLPGGGAE